MNAAAPEGIPMPQSDSPDISFAPLMRSIAEDLAAGGGGAPPPDPEEIFSGELLALFEASRHILGYIVHLWFTLYLEVIAEGARRGEETAPSDGASPRRVSDAVTISANGNDLGRLAYAIGLILFIRAGHDWANRRWVAEERKAIFYLRGYDFQGAVQPTPGAAFGVSTFDTTQFNFKIAELFGKHFDVFKVISPQDLQWETSFGQRYFLDDVGGLLRSSRGPLSSFYLSASSWQEGVREIAERSDHFIVYVGALNSGVLWELDLLDSMGRARDVTVVVDRRSIEARSDISETFSAAAGVVGPPSLRWNASATKSTDVTLEDIERDLRRRFLVLSPEELERDIGSHVARIGATSRPSGRKRSTVPLEMLPSVSTVEVERIETMDDELAHKMGTSEASPTGLNAYLGDIQLWIATSVLLGRDRHTGQGLAAYAAVMETLARHSDLVSLREGQNASVDVNLDLRPILQNHRRLAEFVRSHISFNGGR